MLSLIETWWVESFPNAENIEGKLKVTGVTWVNGLPLSLFKITWGQGQCLIIIPLILNLVGVFTDAYSLMLKVNSRSLGVKVNVSTLFYGYPFVRATIAIL